MENYVKYREAAQQSFAALPYPAWKRIGFANYPEPVLVPAAVKAEIDSDLALAGLDSLSEEQAQAFYQKINQQKYGVDAKFVRLTEGWSNFSRVYHLKRGQVVEKPVHICFDLSGEAMLADEHLIYAEPGAEMSLVLEYQAQNSNAAKASEYHVGLVKVIAGENAQIKVYVAQTLPESKVHIMNVVAECAADAKVSFYSVDLGSEVVASDYRSYLQGKGAAAAIEGVYLGEADNRLDLSYNVQHFGKNTDSFIEVNGALAGNAKKVFRGDIYFHKGSQQSTGKEAEYVILLSKNTKADAIPALFCDEDDVSGEHAANAGTVDENKMFYLMSRGFSETDAKKLIIRASFSGVFDQLPLPELIDRLEKKLEGKLEHVG